MVRCRMEPATNEGAMPQLRRQLHYAMKGSMGNDEDWYTLVFDTETHELYIEHEWDHVPQRGGKVDKGQSRLTIKQLLDQSYRATQHTALLALIEGLFQNTAKPK